MCSPTMSVSNVFYRIYFLLQITVDKKNEECCIISSSADSPFSCCKALEKCHVAYLFDLSKMFVLINRKSFP